MGVGVETLHCVLQTDPSGTRAHTQAPIAECRLADESPYMKTTGNFTGLTKEVQRHWDSKGINPSDLIAEMKATRPPEPAWNAAKYNPVLAAIGDDLDF